MKVFQRSWLPKVGWSGALDDPGSRRVLVLVFADRGILEDGEPLDDLGRSYPGATIIGCSTAGEIEDVQVRDGSLVATVIGFDHTEIRAHAISCSTERSSRETGIELGRRFDPVGLSHVMVFSEGVSVNGSRLVEGLREALGPDVSITGGLAGDGGAFERTSVVHGGKASAGVIAAVGLYGNRLRIGYGSLGGWDQFGPERIATRSEENVLYEVDGAPVLKLYKTYLGDHAVGLPATGLLFPLMVRPTREDEGIVRTILGMDEESGSLVFAGDVPEGSLCRLMKANINRLVDGAVGAAEQALTSMEGTVTKLCVCISCVGRKMVLKQRVEEEVEAVREVLGEQAILTGFYSYGEICPAGKELRCELHNQTMTVTTFAEDDD